MIFMKRNLCINEIVKKWWLIYDRTSGEVGIDLRRLYLDDV